MVVSVSTAIKVENIRLDDILTRHADRLCELEADDPPLEPRPAFTFTQEGSSGIEQETRKRPRQGSPDSDVAPAPAAVAADSSVNTHTEEKKKQRRENRAARRAVAQEVDGRKIKQRGLERVIEAQAIPSEISLESHHIPVAASGWMGRRDTAILNAAAATAKEIGERGQPNIPTASFHNLDDEALKDPHFRILKADPAGSGKVVIDADNRVFILAIPQPGGEKNWKKVTQDVSTAVDNAAKEIFGPNYDQEVPTADGNTPRGGPHFAQNAGLGMGGGQQEPAPFAMHDSVRKICAGLFANTAIMWFLGFANCLFQAYAPGLYAHYFDAMTALLGWNEALFPFCTLSMCVFASATFNFGPRTITFPHLDFLNLAWGWCFITRWHWFPPGMTIAIPSAIFRHSNVSIQQDEKRFSITQYTSAGVFRFVKNGFKTNVTLEQEMTKEEAQAWADAAKAVALRATFAFLVALSGKQISKKVVAVEGVAEAELERVRKADVDESVVIANYRTGIGAAIVLLKSWLNTIPRNPTTELGCLLAQRALLTDLVDFT
ncbi:hypothetical protein B0H14DRAFT_3503084 [Mycena olivaceomarginata]|nr:hypothetical protein B0H14DRAFT_3503084 [Mycena olivaceomarginata]